MTAYSEPAMLVWNETGNVVAVATNAAGTGTGSVHGNATHAIHLRCCVVPWCMFGFVGRIPSTNKYALHLYSVVVMLGGLVSQWQELHGNMSVAVGNGQARPDDTMVASFEQ